jgi:TonB family protein
MNLKFYFLMATSIILTNGTACAHGQTDWNLQRVGQTSDSANSSAPGSKDHPIRVSGGVMAGLLLHKVDPVYPEDAKNVSGAVVLSAAIDSEGNVVGLSVVAGPEMLRDAAVNAVKQWIYKPYLLNGKPVYVQTVITINFAHRP